ncbi:NAD(P)H-dependent oxidoreductase [Verticiella sediminum]|uniref:NAD(P)H-dependent oxidoreductase n=1 Tax=Verticiella sediminum TaxID=1247510 RepID=A0A556ATX1_9BURK|nr:NAD(P)H-dependent oxidoreductase [Verticiella sediminum]TSH96393.1 NAD(P)H-dependent oxidoreductase [Verticiella sediminum]
MNSKPRIAVIIGSPRPTRFADKPAPWILKQAKARTNMDVELVDLREHPMPFFDEISTNRFVPSLNPEAVRWQETVGKRETRSTSWSGGPRQRWLRERSKHEPCS